MMMIPISYYYFFYRYVYSIEAGGGRSRQCGVERDDAGEEVRLRGAPMLCHFFCIFFYFLCLLFK